MSSPVGRGGAEEYRRFASWQERVWVVLSGDASAVRREAFAAELVLLVRDYGDVTALIGGFNRRDWRQWLFLLGTGFDPLASVRQRLRGIVARYSGVVPWEQVRA